MRKPESNGRKVKRDELAPPPLSLLDDPLGYIGADHDRQRSACRALRQLATEMEIDRRLAGAIVAFFVRDLPLHHQDEDEDLFPLLLKRSLPEDGLATLLTQLSGDHIKAAAMVVRIVETITPAGNATTININRRTAGLARDYADREHRHLAIENAIVMVIARKRLKADDLLVISRSMKARRGVPTS
jgi:hemerythrin-like domain-containing protein